MKKILFLSLTFLICFFANAQEKYLEHIFDEIRTETYTYAHKDGEDLDLDLYMPAFDADTARATIIYAHGGAFMEGTRNSESIQAFCKEMAGYGYVVASISYRLTRKDKPEGFGCDCTATDKLNTFFAASEDMQDAAYFLIQHREEFAIDPYRVILAGSSAGAETALNTAYQPPYCYELESGPVSYAGVISIAGAIPDTTVIYEESAVPSLLIHGTDDETVPYASGPHRLCNENDPGYLILNGSYTITHKLAQLDVPYWLYTICGGGHEITGKPLMNYLDTMVDFCYNFIIKKEKESRNTVVKDEDNTAEISAYGFCGE